MKIAIFAVPRTTPYTVDEVAALLLVLPEDVEGWVRDGKVDVHAPPAEDGRPRFTDADMCAALKPNPGAFTHLLKYDELRLGLWTCQSVVDALLAAGLLAARSLPNGEMRFLIEDVMRVGALARSEKCDACGEASHASSGQPPTAPNDRCQMLSHTWGIVGGWELDVLC